MSKNLKMCPDPACGKESPEEAENCIGCGIDFDTYSMMDKILGARERAQAADKDKNNPPKNKSNSPFGKLFNKGKK